MTTASEHGAVPQQPTWPVLSHESVGPSGWHREIAQQLAARPAQMTPLLDRLRQAKPGQPGRLSGGHMARYLRGGESDALTRPSLKEALRHQVHSQYALRASGTQTRHSRSAPQAGPAHPDAAFALCGSHRS